MTGNIEELTLHTNLGIVNGDSAYLKDVCLHIRNRILKNQARVADLEKRIKRLMVFVENLNDVAPDDENIGGIVKYFNNVFGDIEAEK